MEKGMADPQENLSNPSSSSSGFFKREDMLGKQVVGTDALVVGTVKDLAVSSDGRVALQVTKKNQDGGNIDMFLGSEEIQAVGDVILLKNPSRRAGTGMAPSQVETLTSSQTSSTASITSPPTYPTTAAGSRVCSRCGYTNSSGSRFCIKCGQSLT
jgi:sporulation protein YlmC with PRC-barrel domain